MLVPWHPKVGCRIHSFVAASAQRLKPAPLNTQRIVTGMYDARERCFKGIVVQRTSGSSDDAQNLILY